MGLRQEAVLCQVVSSNEEDVRHKIRCLCELYPKDVGQSQIEQLHKIDECVVEFHILEKDVLYFS